MTTAYIVSTADAWHSNDSKLTIGVFDCPFAAIDLLIPRYELTEDDQRMLREYGQTQGREVNLMIDSYILNQLHY